MGEHKLKTTIELTEEEKARIARDQSIPYAAKVVNFPLDDLEGFERGLENAMLELNNRAMAAGMVVLNTTFQQSSYAIEDRDYITVMVVCQWLGRDKLEAMQRQERLTQGMRTGGGRA